MHLPLQTQPVTRQAGSAQMSGGVTAQNACSVCKVACNALTGNARIRCIKLCDATVCRL